MSINSPLSGLASPVSGLRGSSQGTPLILVSLAEIDFSALYLDLEGLSLASYGESVARAEGAVTLLSTDANTRPVLAREPETGARNALYSSNVFTDASHWSTTNSTVTEVEGGFRLQDSGAGGSNTVIVRQIYTAASGTNTFSVEAKADQLSQIAIRAFGFDTSDTSFFDLSEVSVLSEGASHTATITALENGWTRASIEFSTTTDLTGVFYIYVSENSLVSVPLDGTSSVLIRRAQAEDGSLSAYQEALSPYNITEAGVRTVDYLLFDGVDDELSNASFDTFDSDWTVGLGTQNQSNLAVQFSSANIYTSSTTVSAQVNGTFTAPEPHEGLAIISQFGSDTLVRTTGVGFTSTATSLYANTSAELTVSGGAKLYAFDVYGGHLTGASLDAAIGKIQNNLGAST